ncbi:hypothetical protein [Luteolibacter sp. LG18]|uniref:hypothetical protein n=1 Tax=Luteolibacter sp. LG18 TaxID=2819286 RepID=UPI002B2FE0A0|nr:hypothetical protein llg_12630 [Luteolibacter sp. LG18]
MPLPDRPPAGETGWCRHSARARCYRSAAWWLCLGGLALPLGLVVASLVAAFLHRPEVDLGNRDSNLVAVAVLVGAIACLVVGIGFILRGFFRSRARRGGHPE